MKKSILSVLVAMVLVACTKTDVDNVGTPELSVPEQITVGFADNTRIELNEDGKTVWTQGDYASVFYRSNANQKWQYQGETGERTGALRRVAVGSKTADISRVVVVYPYNENYYINPETCDVEATLPATQTYKEDSYGVGSNLMISSGYYNQFSLKNVLGWLKIQLKGEGQVVKSISLRGNNGEQVAGQLYVNSSDATSILASDMGIADDDENSAGGGLIFDDAIIKEVTLSCPDGVELQYLKATSFYIALPPQTFSQGITITVTYDDESTMVKTTSNSITIDRNVIQPMEELFYDGNEVPVYQLLYKTTDNNPLSPKGDPLADGITVLSNEYDPETGYIAMKFSGKVTRIPTYFLESYSTLTSVIIPDCVETIGYSAFTFCGNLTDITFSKNLKTIEGGAFSSGCSRTLNIPKSVTSIGATAFNANLNTIYYEGSLEEWCKISFGNQDAVGLHMNLFTTENGVLTELKGDITLPADYINGKSYILNGLAGVTSITLATGIETIGDFAFMNCTDLKQVILPESLKKINNAAFNGCTNLETINIPTTVENIANCFQETAISRIDITDLSAYCKINFSGYASLFKYDHDNTGLYLNGTLIEDLVIPDDCESIGNYAFQRYLKLKSVSIPGSVKRIGENAFYDCYNISSITLAEGVETIGESSFRYNTSLTSITIPASVTLIEGRAFRSCSNLKSVVLKPTTPPTLHSRVFEENAAGRKLYVLDYDALDSYKTVWSEYASDIEFAGIIYKAASQTSPYTYHGSFSNGATLTKNSFDEQTGTGALSFDNLIYELPSYYFCMVSAITHVTLPSTITTIERQVFDRTSISEIVIPDSVTSLGESTLSCQSLTKVTLSKNLQTIGGYCFSGCSNLESISLPQTLTDIGERAFSFCPLLNNVVLPNLVTAIGTECFRGCGSLTNITLNEGLEIIGQSAFEGVPFEEITIPSTVTFIGNTAFHNNSNLLRVYCKPTIPPTSLKYGSAFMSYNENLVIYVPEASVDYYKNCEGDDTRKHWAYVEDIIQGYPF
ncbi:MAG: leucine-rich repeat domain-containing protein [Alistipes sp.]|nr:leucine-rich repeat domain-containing protein [Alistipes sp.]